MTTFAIAAIEAARTEMIVQINQTFDDLKAQLAPATAHAHQVYKTPTAVDGHDPRNKNGTNLTPRGLEILFRAFDDGAGYNRAAKLLNITQAAAKNRKVHWTKLGGVNRTKMLLDIDQSGQP